MIRTFGSVASVWLPDDATRLVFKKGKQYTQFSTIIHFTLQHGNRILQGEVVAVECLVSLFQNEQN
jgi:hypothetical protein